MRRTQAEAALREGVSADLKGQSHSLLLDVLEKGKGNKAETLLFLLDQDDVRHFFLFFSLFSFARFSS